MLQMKYSSLQLKQFAPAQELGLVELELLMDYQMAPLSVPLMVQDLLVQ